MVHASAEAEPAIEVEGLGHSYASQPALRSVSFRVSEGEHVALLGRNGAGKTTLLKILAGVLEPTTGRLRLAGASPSSEDPRWRRRLGFLPEHPPLHDEMTVRAYLRYVARLRGAGPRAAARVIERCRLGEGQGQRIGTLSHGHRQRVGLAQALVHEPRVLLLDEPAAGLDPAQTAALRELLQSLDLTLVLSSHLLTEVARIATRTLVLESGRLVQDFHAAGDAAWVRLRVEAAADAPGPRRVLAAAIGERYEALDEGTFRLAPADRAAACRALIEAGHELVALERPTDALAELEALFGEVPP